MTDDTSAAVERLRLYIEYDGGALPTADARAILAHIASLEARAEKAEAAAKDWSLQADKLARALDRRPTDADLNAMVAREAALRAAAARLNAELDAFWNEPAEIKYPEGRMNAVYERLITDAQMACRQALAAAPAAPESRERELDKRRLDGLRELCGYVEDGSETSVNISQDDATRDWIIRAGKRWWHGRSLRAAIDAALQPTSKGDE